MNKKLIINADDFGYSRGVNLGIIDAHVNGVVTSTTMLATLDGFDHGCELAKQTVSLGIGVHLTVDVGRPVLDATAVPSMIDESGYFKSYDFNQESLGLNKDEVYHEWKAQINKVADASIDITHLDSHHHAHMHKDLFPIFIQLAKEFKLPIRYGGTPMPEYLNSDYSGLVEGLSYPDCLATDFYQQGVSLETLESHFKRCPQVLEIMCHPAYLDQELMSGSSYNSDRMKEIKLLMSPDIKELINKYNYQLTSYKTL